MYRLHICGDSKIRTLRKQAKKCVKCEKETKGDDSAIVLVRTITGATGTKKCGKMRPLRVAMQEKQIFMTDAEISASKNQMVQVLSGARTKMEDYLCF